MQGLPARGLTDDGGQTGLQRVTVILPGPLDIPASVERYRRWGDDLLERWDGQRLLRAVQGGGGTAVPYAVRPPDGASSAATVEVEVTVGRAGDMAPATAAVTGSFVQAPAGALEEVCSRDPVVAQLNERYPGVRPVLEPDPFMALLRAISSQQVNLTWAATTRRRLAELRGSRHMLGLDEVWSLSAAQVAGCEAADIRALQFTWAKATSIVAVARAVAGRPETFAELAELPDVEVIARLVALPGIGAWSADWYLARTLGRPVVVAGDLGVRKAVGRAYLGGQLPAVEQTRELTNHWGAAAGVVQELLLHDLQWSGATLESRQSAQG